MANERGLQVVTLASVVAVLWGAAPSWAADMAVGTCKPRDAVEAVEREPYERAALEFMSHLVRENVSQAYSRMTDELRNSLSMDQFMAGLKPNAEAIRSLGPQRVARSYLVESDFMTGKSQFVICEAEANALMSEPQGRVFVAAKPVPKQAHVVIEGSGHAGTWTFSLWLIPEHGSWLIQGFHEAPPPKLEKTAAELWTSAKDQQHKGHGLSAYLLYGLVSAVTYRGPNFQLGLWSDSQNEAKGLSLPPEVRGQPPFIWKLGNSVFRILSLSPAASDDHKLALRVSYQADGNSGLKLMEDQNQDLIRELRSGRPEYLDGFELVIAEAVGASGQRVRSVGKTH